MDQRLKKWEKWLEAIRYEVMDLVRSKHIFWKLGDIVKNNPKIQKPNSFYKFAGDTYFAYGVMGIRRQIKPHRNSISFAGLLHEIVKTPYILSRERFVALYERNSHYEANHDFGQFAREDAEYIDPNKVRRDLDKLKKLGRAVEVFADKRIAHYDKQLVENVPSFGELDDCINFLAELTEKYWLLFKAETLVDLLVMPIVDNWEEIFRQPWIPPDTSDKSIDPDPLGMY
ncbi:MAG: hypothetical protein OXD49_00310 [Candidatus Poribacteria bacterium]|nr:hypothetical protein [Candidatus Poribacteria bacterium]